jgi:hypothetical protein
MSRNSFGNTVNDILIQTNPVTDLVHCHQTVDQN